MPPRFALPLILIVAFMMAGCGGAADDGTTAAFSEISTPFTAEILENLQTSDDDVSRGLSEAHRRHFEHLGHLAFEDSVILGYISHVDVRDDGTFLLVDMPGRTAHLFSASGQLVRSLDPTECDPGVNWMPNDGAFLSDGRIVMANNDARSTIRFTEDGACDRFIEPDMNVPDDIASLADGRFVTHEESFEEHWLAERDSDGSEIRTFGRSEAFTNLNYRMSGRNYMAAFSNGRLAVALPWAPAPTVYSAVEPDGIQLFPPPEYVRSIENDIRDTRGMSQDEMIDEIRGFFSNHTLITGLFPLSDESLLVLYRHGFRDPEDEDYLTVRVSDLEGRTLTPNDPTFAARTDGVTARFFPLHAKDNLVFTVRPAEELPNGDWGNPGLDVWRFTPAPRAE